MGAGSSKPVEPDDSTAVINDDTFTKWAWRSGTGLFIVPVNTLSHIRKQLVATKEATRTLITKKPARDVLDKMTYILVYNVLPMLGAHYVNDQIQAGLWNESAQDNWETAQNAALTLADSLLQVATIRFGAQAAIQMVALTAFGPPAFYADKEEVTKLAAPCQDCNTARFIKGYVGEMVILQLHKRLLTWVDPLSALFVLLLKAELIGRYITWQATPGWCARHKNGIMNFESALAFGLIYIVLETSMHYLLFASDLYEFVLTNMILLLLINVAVHMQLPTRKDSALFLDPFNPLEWTYRFIVNSLITGAKKEIPKAFEEAKKEEAKEKKAPSWFSLSRWVSLSRTLRFANNLVESDLYAKSSRFKWVVVDLNPFVPALGKSFNAFRSDPVIAKYWEEVCVSAIAKTSVLKQYQNSAEAIANNIPATAQAMMGNLLSYFCVPEDLTKISFMLCQENNFWILVKSVHMWLERHSAQGISDKPESSKSNQNYIPLYDGPPSEPKQPGTPVKRVIDDLPAPGTDFEQCNIALPVCRPSETLTRIGTFKNRDKDKGKKAADVPVATLTPDSDDEERTLDLP